MNLIFALGLTLLVNLPFGYYRQRASKFSGKWFFAVHLPIPLVVLIRISFDLGFELHTYPLMVFAFFLGQYFGGVCWNLLNKRTKKIPIGNANGDFK